MSEDGLAVDLPIEPPFPGFTEWEHRELYCFRDLIYIPAIKKYFWRHWEVSLPFPIAVLTIIISSFLIEMFSILPSLGLAGKILMVVQSIFCFLFTYSYLKIIIEGPGYYSFYWPMKHEGFNDESPLLDEEDPSPSGIMSNEDQEKWARKREKPNRCILSRSARRIVIRPDHFCDWVQIWIGKRNYKFFILFNTYGFIYIITFLVTDFLAMVVTMRNNPNVMLVIYLIYFFLSFMFSMFTGIFMSTHIQGMIINQTNWEEWNKISKYNKGCIRNMEDVCGPRKQMYLWICPTSPFKGVSNSDIVGEYEPYNCLDPNDDE